MRAVLVIPCYNEFHRLNKEEFLTFLEAHFALDCLFVDDGSRDETLTLLKDLQAVKPEKIHVLSLPENKGKAEAVRWGLRHAYKSGFEFIAYWDADLATPLSDALDMLRIFDSHADLQLILGSRILKLGNPIHRKRLRHYLGRLFATAVSQITGLRVYDSQCGAKMMRAELVPVITEEPFTSKWFFDVEILLRIKKKYDPDKVCFEMPVSRWLDVGGSKLKFRDFVRAPAELLRIWRHYQS